MTVRGAGAGLCCPRAKFTVARALPGEPVTMPDLSRDKWASARCKVWAFKTELIKLKDVEEKK